MSTTNIAVVIAVILLIAVGGFVFLSADRGEEMSATTQSDTNSTLPSRDNDFDKAPSFALEDYDGNTVRSDDFAGNVLVINAWATWCPFCVDELPDFERLQQEFPEEIVVIAIDRAESRERAKSFTDDLGVTDGLVLLLDPRDSFYRSIGGFSMPETIFVDADGNIRIHKRGPMELDEMREKVISILNDEGG